MATATATVEVPKLNKKQKAVIARIRKLVQETHWTKYYYESETSDGKPQYCMVGFVNKAYGLANLDVESNEEEDYYLSGRLSDQKVKDRRKVLNAMYAAIKKVKPRTKATSIESFNDSRSTKREDVLAVLDLLLQEGES